jgi:hypothetical protein
LLPAHPQTRVAWSAPSPLTMRADRVWPKLTEQQRAGGRAKAVEHQRLGAPKPAAVKTSQRILDHAARGFFYGYPTTLTLDRRGGCSFSASPSVPSKIPPNQHRRQNHDKDSKHNDDGVRGPPLIIITHHSTRSIANGDLLEERSFEPVAGNQSAPSLLGTGLRGGIPYRFPMPSNGAMKTSQRRYHPTLERPCTPI